MGGWDGVRGRSGGHVIGGLRGRGGRTVGCGVVFGGDGRVGRKRRVCCGVEGGGRGGGCGGGVRMGRERGVRGGCHGGIGGVGGVVWGWGEGVGCGVGKVRGARNSGIGERGCLDGSGFCCGF